MNQQMLQYEWFLKIAPIASMVALLAFGVSVFVAKRKIFPLQALLFCSAGILIFNFLELSVTEESTILLFSHITYVFIAFCPVFWILFIIEYTWGKQGLQLLLSLSVIPCITSLIASFDPLRYLLWREHEIRQLGDFTVNVVILYGPWFWIHFLYSYSLQLIGVVIIVHTILSRHAYFRRQSILVLLGGTLPLFLNIVYVFRLLPGITKDFFPIGIAISGALFTLSIVRYGFLDLKPVSRERLYDRLGVGIIALDTRWRVLDINTAALQLLGFSGQTLVGIRLQDLLRLGGRQELLPHLGPEGGVPRIPPRTFGMDLECRIDTLPGRNGDITGYCIALFPIGAGMAAQQSPSVLPVETAREHPPEEELTRREREVALLLTDGCTNKEIAARLFVSENTVKTHVRRVLHKCGAHDREEFIRRRTP